MRRMWSLTALVLTVALAGGAAAAGLSPSVSAEVRRGAAAVGARDSDAPALRREAATGGPSDGFAAGAALAAWRNASAGLSQDLAHPLGDGGEAGTLRSDCFDEKMAFRALDAAGGRLGASPSDLVGAAGLDGQIASRWISRRAAPPAACG
jgi:hypothetical protein